MSRDPVLVVGPLPPPLNGMTVMTALARLGLAREGVALTHLDLSDQRNVGNVGRLDARNVALALGHFIRMLGALSRPRPRLVYLPIAQSTLGFLRDALLFLAARLHRVPVAVHLHGASFGAFYQDASAPMRAIVRWCLRDVRVALVLGDSGRRAFDGLIPPERIHVLPNGIPGPPRFLPAAREEDRFDVLYMSNLIPGKGYRDLIEALPFVARRYPALRARFAGEWPSDREREEILQNQIRRLGIEPHVRFVSSATGIRKAQLFQGARMFVFPPTALEGQPVVILEAMSYGLPVVTTPLGGIRETVADNETGLIVPPARPETLAWAILRLLEDEPLRARLGEAGRLRFLRRHRLAAFQRDLAGLLEPEVC